MRRSIGRIFDARTYMPHLRLSICIAPGVMAADHRFVALGKGRRGTCDITVEELLSPSVFDFSVD